MFEIRGFVDNLQLANGLSLTLESDALTVFVGPNNAGKSAALNDIKRHLGQAGREPVVISGLHITRSTSKDDILNNLRPYANLDGNYSLGSTTLYEFNLDSWWQPNKNDIGSFFFKYLVSDLSTRSRLADCDPQPSFDARDPFAANHPFQHLYRDSILQQRVSEQIRYAFKSDLVVHMASGKSIALYLGLRPEMDGDENPVSRSYLDRLELLPKLEEQGDGVRAFVSIVSRVMTEKRSIQLIDEPEAFLHPPQARMIGEIIAAQSEGRQTFVATHSSSFIQGLLASGSRRISVVRLSRTQDSVKAAHLDNASIQAFWKDPILRFSDVLSGIFHDAVIVTEADADCRFYEALIDAVTPFEARASLHYTYSGGKDRIATVVSALTALSVPVATIVDFDILNAELPLKSVFQSLGGSWDEISSDWNVVKNAVESGSAFLSGDEYRRLVKLELDRYGTGLAVPREVLSAIRKVTRNASAWDRVKMSGLAALPSGEPTVSAKRLLRTLNKHGLFVVPVGEMEGFCRDFGRHGPKWVEKVLDLDLTSAEELIEARKFAKSIQAFVDASLDRTSNKAGSLGTAPLINGSPPA